MRLEKWITTTVLAMVLAAGACEVDQTREAELPDLDVDVDAERGQMPAYDIDGPDVNVGVRETTVTVPKLRVETETEEITVPYIDIDFPGAEDDAERQERELAVEFDVDHGGYQVEIEEVRAHGDQLYVIARLNEGDAGAEGPNRVSDRVIINAPDSGVRYYVIGEPPNGSVASRYRFVGAESALPQPVRDAKVIYQG